MLSFYVRHMRLCSRLCQSGWGPEQHIQRRSLNLFPIHPNWPDKRTKTPHVPLQLVASTTMTRKLSQPSRVTDLCLEHRNSHSAIHEIKNTMKKHKQQRIYNISKFCLRLSAQLPCPPWFESERNAFIKLMVKNMILSYNWRWDHTPFQNKDQHANMPTCKQVKQDIFKGQSVLHRTRNTINSICEKPHVLLLCKKNNFTKQNRIPTRHDNKKCEVRIIRMFFSWKLLSCMQWCFLPKRSEQKHVTTSCWWFYKRNLAT